MDNMPDGTTSLASVAITSGACSAIASFLVSSFLVGRRVGKAEAKIAEHTTEIAELRGEFKKDGEPRYVTYAAHDKIQQSCQGLMNMRLGNIEAQIEKQDKKLDLIINHLPRRKDDSE